MLAVLWGSRTSGDVCTGSVAGGRTSGDAGSVTGGGTSGGADSVMG